MSKVQKWGREESLIWPPRGFYYTYGAIFLAVVLAGFLVYLRFSLGLSQLEKYYLPYYLRTETTGILHPTGVYQLIYIFDRQRALRPALDSDLQPGLTPQMVGTALPFQLSPAALQQGPAGTTPGQITVSAYPTGLTAGTYSCVIKVTAGGTTKRVYVVLVVARRRRRRGD